MLAAEFVKAEVKEFLDDHKDQLSPYTDAVLLVALSGQIIKAYELYKASVKVCKCEQNI